LVFALGYSLHALLTGHCWVLRFQVVAVQAPVHDGAAEQFSFLLVEPQPSSSSEAPTPRVHILPNIPSVSAAVTASSSNTFFWLQQQQTDTAAAATVLRGYSLAAGAQADAEGVVPVVPAWQVALPGQLLALARRDPTEPVHSYVKVSTPILLALVCCCTVGRLRHLVDSLGPAASIGLSSWVVMYTAQRQHRSMACTVVSTQRFSLVSVVPICYKSP
jgi:hypothetical protein